MLTAAEYDTLAKAKLLKCYDLLQKVCVLSEATFYAKQVNERFESELSRKEDLVPEVVL